MDGLTPYQEVALRVSSGSSWRVIIMRTESWGRKASMMTDITNTAVGKK
jgi:hypothetical protein